MNKIARLILVVLSLVLAAASANAQEIKVRRAAPATPVVTSPAPTAPAVVAPTTVTPAPSSAPADEVAVESVQLELPGDQMKKLNAIETKVNNINEFMVESIDIVNLHKKMDSVRELQESVRGSITVLVFAAIVIMLASVFAAVFSFMNWMKKPVVVAPHDPWTTEDTSRTRRVAPVVLLALGLGLEFASQAQAQTAAAKAAPACTIRSFSPPVVVKEQDPVPVTISLRNCTGVDDLKIATDPSNFHFTEVVQKGNIVTAKLVADAGAQTGLMSVSAVLANGTEVESPDAVNLLVLDTQTAVVRRDATAATDRVARSVAVTNKNVTDLQVKLGDRPTTLEVHATLEAALEKLAASRPTLEQMKAYVEGMFGPMQKQVNDLSILATALNGDVSLLNKVSVEQSVLIKVLADTEVKKGFWGGKKPHNMEVAAAAARIAEVVESSKQIK